MHSKGSLAQSVRRTTSANYFDFLPSLLSVGSRLIGGNTAHGHFWASVSCGILKIVGPKKQDFWPRINILKDFFFQNPLMNYGSSKSAKIVLSKSIFEVKNQLNLLKKNLGLGQIFCPKD